MAIDNFKNDDMNASESGSGTQDTSRVPAYPHLMSGKQGWPNLKQPPQMKFQPFPVPMFGMGMPQMPMGPQLPSQAPMPTPPSFGGGMPPQAQPPQGMPPQGAPMGELSNLQMGGGGLMQQLMQRAMAQGAKPGISGVFAGAPTTQPVGKAMMGGFGGGIGGAFKGLFGK